MANQRYALSNNAHSNYGYITELSQRGDRRTYYGYGCAAGLVRGGAHRYFYDYNDALHVAHWLNLRARGYDNISPSALRG